MIALIVGAVIAVTAAVIVALPFIRDPSGSNEVDFTPVAEARLGLLEARDRALAALKELEFDHRTGKIDDTDYRRLVGPLRRAAAEALQGLDRLDAAAVAPATATDASTDPEKTPAPAGASAPPGTTVPAETPAPAETAVPAETAAPASPLEAPGVSPLPAELSAPPRSGGAE